MENGIKTDIKTDVTSWNDDELTALFMMIFTDTTQPLINEDGKITAEPIYKTGIGFDTESTTISHYETKGKRKQFVVDHCFCYMYQIAFGENYYALYRNFNKILHVFDILIDTLNYLNVGQAAPAKVLIWVANLSHEFSFIKYKIMQHMECKKMFAKTQRDVLYLNFSCIEFRECLGLFGHSLQDISKNWTTTKKLKGDLDYDKIRTEITPLTEQEQQYCINDVIILAEMHTAVLNEYTQDNGVLILPYTASGFVRMKLKDAIRNDEKITDERENYNKRCDPKKIKKTNIEYMKMCNKHLFVDADQWKLTREYGYSGGLCGSNIKHVGKVLKNVQCADLTSDYPAQMLHEKFPCGWLKENKIEHYSTIKKKKIPYFIMCIVDFESKTQHATFSKHKALNQKHPAYIKRFGTIKEMIVYNGKILRAKNCVCILNDVDISAYEMIYKLKITPVKLWTFDKYGKLPEWLKTSLINDYVKKAVLKHDGKQNTQEYKDAKRDANTYYGVLATRYQDVLDVFTDGIFENSKTKTFAQQRCDCWLNPYVAFWVTSYARRILMYFISKYPDKIVQYDTDSLYYLPCKGLEKELKIYNETQIELNKSIFKDNENIDLLLDLGCFDKYEKDELMLYEQFLPLGAKKYIKQHGDKIQTVIAGLPKDAIPREIVAENIKKPLQHYNVVRYVTRECQKPELIIKHMFTHKFASVYNDSELEYKTPITDYLGNTYEQTCGCYHALAPIDFTLSLGVTYLKHILHIQNRDV